MNTKRQFIAGAVCPQCQKIDKIQLVREALANEQSQEKSGLEKSGQRQNTAGKSYYECVACGYHRSDIEFEQSQPVNADDPQPVQIMRPSDKR